MLALVDGQYKFRWVDVGTAGSCSDAQILNTCHLKRKIDDGNIGFPDPAPITQGGRDIPYCILADDVFALKTWLMRPYGRRMLTREERIDDDDDDFWLCDSIISLILGMVSVLDFLLQI